MAQASTTGYAVMESEAPQKQPMKKKIGFFKRWMLKAVKEAVDAERQQEVNLAPDISTKSLRISRADASIDQPERAIHFTVYVANGGRVVETKRYDRKTDRSTNGLYIVHNDQDFGKEIDKIIVMEGLR